MDLVIGGDAVNCFKQILSRNVGSDLFCSFTLQSDHLDAVEPIEPGQGAALKSAHWAIAIEKENVFFPLHLASPFWSRRDSRIALASAA